MHVFGVGSTGNIGSSVRQMLDRNYNPSNKYFGGESFKSERVGATLNNQVRNSKLVIDSNRLAKIQRPFVSLSAEVRDIWAEVGDSQVNHVTFLTENRPTMDYKYYLADDEIRGLVDAGLYRNPRFEALFSKILDREQFEIVSDVDVQSITVKDGDKEVPVILANDVGLIEHNISEDDETYTTFSDSVYRAIDFITKLEQEGIQNELIDDQILDEEVEVEIDDVFDLGLDGESLLTDVDHEDVVEKSDLDQEVDISDKIDYKELFGQTSEEERIMQMKEEEDLARNTFDFEDSVETEEYDEDELDKLDSFDKMFGSDIEDDSEELDFIKDDQDFELEDEMVFDVDLSSEDEKDEIDEDDFDLEF